MKKKITQSGILELCYCLEHQYYLETRVMLLAGGGLWKNEEGRVPYYEWCEKLWAEAFDIWIKNIEDFNIK